MAKKFSAISVCTGLGMYRCKSYSSSPYITKWNNYRTSAEFIADPMQMAAFLKAIADAGIVEHIINKGQYDLPDGKWVDVTSNKVYVRSPKKAARYTGSLYD